MGKQYKAHRCIHRLAGMLAAVIVMENGLFGGISGLEIGVIHSYAEGQETLATSHNASKQDNVLEEEQQWEFDDLGSSDRHQRTDHLEMYRPCYRSREGQLEETELEWKVRLVSL